MAGLHDLTPSQRRAAEHIHGPLLVLAGPGSGKTRVITQRIACMVEQGIDPRNILSLTFTNKAADE
ncbi:MAG: UvrD-helicase domain-containing protein, partial [Planctomycetes bacterium]|nr:UvrD-helicase domain-containing protein [Planctomycetota bacterium]